jgi:lathosterol oxidase
MASASPPLSSPSKAPHAAPVWARILDGILPFALAGLGLLAPDHRGHFYAALATGFVGIAGCVLAGAALVTLLSERQSERIQGPRRKPAPFLREAGDTALAAFIAACFLAWPLWRSWTGRPIGLVWSIEQVGGLKLVLLQNVAAVFVLDAWLYWKHRLLHSRLMFPFHRAHHAYRDPSALAGFAVGPVESVLTFFPLCLVALPQAPHYAPIYFTLVVGFVSLNYYLHCGVRVALLERILSPLGLNSSAFHNVHHSHANVNFGEAMTLWDRLCRTRLEDAAQNKTGSESRSAYCGQGTVSGSSSGLSALSAWQRRSARLPSTPTSSSSSNRQAT